MSQVATVIAFRVPRDGGASGRLDEFLGRASAAVRALYRGR